MFSSDCSWDTGSTERVDAWSVEWYCSRRIVRSFSDDPRECSLPSRRLSVVVQRLNAVLLHDSFCLSNAIQYIGQNIKWRKRVWCPVSVRRPWTWLRRYLWTNLYQIWNIASPYLTGVKLLSAVRSEVVYAHARCLTDRHSQLSSDCTNV